MFVVFVFWKLYSFNSFLSNENKGHFASRYTQIFLPKRIMCMIIPTTILILGQVSKIVEILRKPCNTQVGTSFGSVARVWTNTQYLPCDTL